MQKSSTVQLKNTPFSELCQHYINFLCSTEGDRVYPDFVKTKVHKHSFRARVANFKYDEERKKLFRKHIDQFGLGMYIHFILLE